MNYIAKMDIYARNTTPNGRDAKYDKNVIYSQSYRNYNSKNSKIQLKTNEFSFRIFWRLYNREPMRNNNTVFFGFNQ